MRSTIAAAQQHVNDLEEGPRPPLSCSRMANAQTQPTPQRLAAIREQLSLLADYL